MFNLHMNALSSLTSNQRLSALRLLNSDLWAKDGFVLICGVILAALIMLFIIVTLLDAIKKKRNSNRLFIEYADKRGLNIRERQILMDIATRARLRLAESIFTMGDVFDRGATQMLRVAMAKYGAKRSRYLSAELSMLREKMGFIKRNSVLKMAIKKGVPSSRKISEGKKIYLTNPESIEFIEVESIIIENSSIGLSVQLQEMFECEPGDAFCARYYSGSVIWEFDTFVLRTKNNTLILQHSDKIRYVNRRRFLRVAVNEPAYIAAFPFLRDFSGNQINKRKTNFESHDYDILEPPKFIPADLIELAGPGLRLLSPVEFKIGDRVVVILKLGYLINRNNVQSNFVKNNTRPFKVIENVGVVRHIEKVEQAYSIALELTNLSESNLSEMVKATNEASLSKRRIQEILPEHKEKSPKYEYISETIIG
ncbi:MAG: hypothetical protein JXA96_13505 [Sedimentisphaerales bacterium]|nr:hypothetical protein [Sedimentisphaerales bacterium]